MEWKIYISGYEIIVSTKAFFFTLKTLINYYVLKDMLLS